MKARLTDWLQRLLRGRGYALVRVQGDAQEPWRGDPCALRARLDVVPRTAVMPIAIARASTRPILDDANPLYRAAREGLGATDAEARRERIHACLAAAITAETATTGAAKLGLAPGSVPRLDAAPPWVNWYPWHRVSLEQRIASTNAQIRIDNAKGGVTLDGYGGGGYGSRDARRVAAETQRLWRLLASIERHGYRRSGGVDADIGGRLLVASSGDCRWMLAGGYHRLSVLAALGHETVLVRIKGVIREDDAPHWAAVTGGEYPEAAAREVFRNVFHAGEV